MPSNKKIGDDAEKESERLWRDKGYAVHKQNYARFQNKDLLATDYRFGFDRVAFKPGSPFVWIQVKSVNGVTSDLLRCYIKWNEDFVVDNIPYAYAVLDVWQWVVSDVGVKEMKIETWDLVKMMSELANRDYKASLSEAKAKAEKEKEDNAMAEELGVQYEKEKKLKALADKLQASVEQEQSEIARSAEDAAATANSALSNAKALEEKESEAFARDVIRSVDKRKVF